MQELNTIAEFNKATAQGQVFLDFWAPWCSPCKALTPVLLEVEKENPKILFCKINADTELGQELGSKYGIGSLPTMMLFQDGKRKRNLIGNTTKAKIEAFLKD